MAKNFATMQSGVGTFCMDSTAAFAALSAIWLNDKYQDISRRKLWSELVNYTYTATAVAGTAEYTLPTDFDQELFVVNTTDGSKLMRFTEGDWFEERYPAYLAGAIASGTSMGYVIHESSGKIQFDPTPNAVKSFTIPYKKVISPLSGTMTAVIKDIETIMEYGATSDGFMYKKNFAKANDFLQKYEYELAKRIGQDNKKVNEQYQWIPERRNPSAIEPFTGWTSYDTISKL